MIFKTVKRSFEIFFFLCALIALVISSVALYAAIEFSRGPVNVTWAQSYIQEALAGGDPNLKVEVGSIIADWRSLRQPLSLGIADMRVIDTGQETLNVSQAGIQLAKWPLLFGVVAPDSIYIKGPAIKLVRNKNGNFSFFVSDKEQHIEPKKQVSLSEIEQQIFLPPFTRSIRNTPGSHLRSVVIENAQISIEDHRFGDRYTLPQAGFTMKRQKDQVIASLSYKGSEVSSLSKITVSLVRHRKDYDYSAKFDNVESDIWIRNLVPFPSLMAETYLIDGQIAGSLDKKWMPKVIAGEISTTNPVFESQTFGVAGKRDDQTGLLPLRVSLAEVTLDQIAILWPPELEDLGITTWLTERLSDGIITDLAVTLPLKVADQKITLDGEVTGDFDFENLTADYRAPLMPATVGFGHGRIVNDALEIDIKTAKLGDADIRDSRVLVTNLTTEPDGVVDIDINLKGPASTVVKYISDEPINLGSSLGMKASDVKGTADMKVEVDFPAVHDLDAKDVAVKVDATLSDMLLPKIVKGLDLSGGPFKLEVAKGAFNIAGKGQLSGHPIDLAYSEYINLDNAPYVSQIKATVSSDDALRKAFGADLSNYVAGTVPLDIDYAEKTKGNVEIEAKADLTQAQFFVRPLQYLKPEGKPGNAAATIILKNGDVSQVKNLNVAIGDDKAINGNLVFGRLGNEIDVTSGSFDNLRLGPDNNVALKIAQDNAGLHLKAEGSTLDARPFLNPKKDDQQSSRKQPLTADVKVKKLRTGDGQEQAVQNADLSLALTGDNDIKRLQLNGKIGADAKADISVDMSPDAAGRTQLSVQTNDAGAAFRTLGVYDNMIGGQMGIKAAQIAGGGINDLEGAATIRDFRIVRAPILARLIGVFSLTGLPDLLMNEGIGFSRMQSRFIWKNTENGRIINLYDGATSGGSIGLTFGGEVNQTQKRVDISGTFVPISQVNKIIGKIPLLGKLLTGGKNGGIIAATYALKGPTEDPNVSVNPLSVITPGFIRSILFEGGMGSGADEAPSKAR